MQVPEIGLGQAQLASGERAGYQVDKMQPMQPMQQSMHIRQSSHSHAPDLPSKTPTPFMPAGNPQPPTGPLRQDIRCQFTEPRNPIPRAWRDNTKTSVTSSPSRRSDAGSQNQQSLAQPATGSPPSFSHGEGGSGIPQNAYHGSDVSLSNRYHGTEQFASPSRPARFSKPFNKFVRRNQGQRNDARVPPYTGGADGHPPPYAKPFRRPSQNWPNGPVGSTPPCANQVGGPYTHCDCKHCKARNRSVWVRVKDAPQEAQMEIQTRLKFGFESRFGRVEDVYPASSAHDRAFIVK